MVSYRIQTAWDFCSQSYLWPLWNSLKLASSAHLPQLNSILFLESTILNYCWLLPALIRWVFLTFLLKFKEYQTKNFLRWNVFLAATASWSFFLRNLKVSVNLIWPQNIIYCKMETGQIFFLWVVTADSENLSDFHRMPRWGQNIIWRKNPY